MANHAHNLRARLDTAHQPGAVGVITRGTTGENRLRRCDRWMVYQDQIRRPLLAADHPLAIDLGYGASHTTTVEWARWLRRIRPDIDVVGLEIAPERVLPPRDGVRFELGGFELAGYRPHLVRAFNVLRQYDVSQVPATWKMVCSSLAPGGRYIEGTCDELGRRCSWVTLTSDGPQSLTLAWDPHHVDCPSQLAERLPKALIHRNTPGEKIYHVLQRLDSAWQRCAGWSPHGPRIRWRKTVEMLRAEGLAIEPQRRPIRDNLVTVPWDLVSTGDDDWQ
ncbi:class I SAM-dependent methyltransferase [Corynebacterium poyangense]|uniref:Class I SAM-dependent methyltransferase n=1 Tax=Corynebacterium poyangense TaxID=2684405 RepID=A0A7H0SLT1_9CORY|nr:class I SAM-dependent methyltransferase [Corynebacterium poyangense]MBZ8177613.1 class I SAM-dependent methyltransferase [Corynebacterium poyangense]QNQ89506.1 class I SAM-dependent methyltransferase [Corynebacterium poyangense]